MLKKLKDAGILRVVREASGSRPAVLAFGELVNQAEMREGLKRIMLNQLGLYEKLRDRAAGA